MTDYCHYVYCIHGIPLVRVQHAIEVFLLKYSISSFPIIAGISSRLVIALSASVHCSQCFNSRVQLSWVMFELFQGKAVFAGPLVGPQVYVSYCMLINGYWLPFVQLMLIKRYKPLLDPELKMWSLMSFTLQFFSDYLLTTWKLCRLRCVT